MFRRTDLIFAALAACAASPMILLAGPANAQTTYPPPPGYYRDPAPPAPPASGWYRMPGPSWSDDDDGDQPAYPRRRGEQYAPRTAQGTAPRPITSDAQEADAGLPPPGLPQQGVPQQQGVPPQVNAPVNNNPDVVRPPAEVGRTPTAAKEPPPVSVATLPPEDQPETGEPQELAPNLKRQLVDYQTKEPAGTLIVDTANTYLYLVLGNGKALRYGVRVGREGFTWAGTERISKMKEWPDWFPPSEMIERQPYLPRFTAGGPGNPLGARAMYLGKTVYRIHGTNQPSTIGKFVSSGCVGMLNEDVEDLYNRVQVGTRVVVIPGTPSTTTASANPANMAPAQGGPASAAAQPAAAASGPAPANGSVISSSPLPPPSKR